MSNQKHTATPWRMGGKMGAPEDRFVVFGENGWAIAKILEAGNDAEWQAEVEANAKFIVRACNSHDELLTVAKGCLGYLKALPESGSCRPDATWLEPLITAITKAEGGSK